MRGWLEICTKDGIAIYEEECLQPIGDLESTDDYLYIIAKLKDGSWVLTRLGTYIEEFDDEVVGFIGPIDIVEK